MVDPTHEFVSNPGLNFTPIAQQYATPSPAGCPAVIHYPDGDEDRGSDIGVETAAGQVRREGEGWAGTDRGGGVSGNRRGGDGATAAEPSSLDKDAKSQSVVPSKSSAVPDVRFAGGGGTDADEIAAGTGVGASSSEGDRSPATSTGRLAQSVSFPAATGVGLGNEEGLQQRSGSWTGGGFDGGPRTKGKQRRWHEEGEDPISPSGIRAILKGFSLLPWQLGLDRHSSNYNHDNHSRIGTFSRKHHGGDRNSKEDRDRNAAAGNSIAASDARDDEDEAKAEEEKSSASETTRASVERERVNQHATRVAPPNQKGASRGHRWSAKLSGLGSPCLQRSHSMSAASFHGAQWMAGGAPLSAGTRLETAPNSMERGFVRRRTASFDNASLWRAQEDRARWRAAGRTLRGRESTTRAGHGQVGAFLNWLICGGLVPFFSLVLLLVLLLVLPVLPVLLVPVLLLSSSPATFFCMDSTAGYGSEMDGWMQVLNCRSSVEIIDGCWRPGQA